jgi:putative resolvase
VCAADLSDPDVSVIVVGHRDRFARFRVAHLQAALTARRRRIVEIDRCEATDDRVRDLIDGLSAANREPGEAA